MLAADRGRHRAPNGHANCCPEEKRRPGDPEERRTKNEGEEAEGWVTWNLDAKVEVVDANKSSENADPVRECSIRVAPVSRLVVVTASRRRIAAKC